MSNDLENNLNGPQSFEDKLAAFEDLQENNNLNPENIPRLNENNITTAYNLINNGEKAIEEIVPFIVLSKQHLIDEVISKLNIEEKYLEDTRQEAQVGLCKGVSEYNIDNRLEYDAYLTLAILNQINKYKHIKFGHHGNDSLEKIQKDTLKQESTWEKWKRKFRRK